MATTLPPLTPTFAIWSKLDSGSITRPPLMTRSYSAAAETPNGKSGSRHPRRHEFGGTRIPAGFDAYLRGRKFVDTPLDQNLRRHRSPLTTMITIWLPGSFDHVDDQTLPDRAVNSATNRRRSSTGPGVDSPEKFYRVMGRRFERIHCEAASAELFSAAVSRGDTLKYISRCGITAAQKKR